MLKKAIIIVLLSGLFNLLISSCCNDVFIVTSDYDTSFRTVKEGNSFSPMNDTIDGAFMYSLEAKVIISAIDLSQFSTLSQSYAYQCPIKYENGYKRETASVVLDKSFYIDSLLISAGTNLLDIVEKTGENMLEISAEEYNAYVSIDEIQITFMDEFIHRLSFPLDSYTFKTTVEMADGTLIQSEETVAISIN